MKKLTESNDMPFLKKIYANTPKERKIDYSKSP